MPLVRCQSDSNNAFGLKWWLNELLLLRFQVLDDDVMSGRIYDTAIGDDMQVILDITPQAPDMPAWGCDVLA